MNIDAVILAVSALWLGSEIVLTRLKHSVAADAKFDGSSLRILWIVIVPSVTLGSILRFQPLGYFGDGSSRFQSVGMALIVAGLTIRWRAILTLKRQFTVDVSIRKDHRIVKTGIYRLIRHPAYAGSLLSFFGLGLFFTNYLSLIVIFLPICSAFLYRMTIEEKILVATFGEEYRDYYRTTKRLLPGVY